MLTVKRNSEQMFRGIGYLALCLLLLSRLGVAVAEDKNIEDMSDFEKCHELGRIDARIAQLEGVPRDYMDLVACYQKVADSGDAEAQHYLGFMYWNGINGVQQSAEEAMKSYRKAAVQGHLEAQYTLGNAYELGQHDFGVGIPRDGVEAVKWYRKAAERGHASAQYRLGLMYDDGEGVPEDDVQAYAWLNIAAAQGSWFAKERKQHLAESITREEIALAQQLAREYWERYVLPFRN